MPESTEKNEVLTDSILNLLNIGRDELQCNSNVTTIDYHVPPALLMIRIDEILLQDIEIDNFRTYVIDHVKWSLLTLFLFYMGLLLGAMSIRIHILLLIFGINWGLAGIVFVGDKFLQILFLNNGLGVYVSVLLPFVLQLFLAVLLYRLARRSLSNRNNKPVLIPHLRN